MDCDCTGCSDHTLPGRYNLLFPNPRGGSNYTMDFCLKNHHCQPSYKYVAYQRKILPTGSPDSKAKAKLVRLLSLARCQYKAPNITTQSKAPTARSSDPAAAQRGQTRRILTSDKVCYVN